MDGAAPCHTRQRSTDGNPLLRVPAWPHNGSSGLASIGVSMAILFQSDQLQVTDDWIRTPHNQFAVRDVRNAWVTRRQVGRGSRMATSALGLAAVLVLIGAAGLSGWLLDNWMWLLAAPVIFFGAAFIGLLDPVAIYLEKRHHELWIQTDAVAVRIWKQNSVEVNKALRAIQRARERHREQYEV